MEGAAAGRSPREHHAGGAGCPVRKRPMEGKRRDGCIPHPAKWLSHRRWQDAAPASQAPGKSYSMPAWAQQTSRPFDPAAAVDILARHRPRRLKRLEA